MSRFTEVMISYIVIQFIHLALKMWEIRFYVTYGLYCCVMLVSKGFFMTMVWAGCNICRREVCLCRWCSCDFRNEPSLLLMKDFNVLVLIEIRDSTMFPFKFDFFYFSKVHKKSIHNKQSTINMATKGHSYKVQGLSCGWLHQACLSIS